MLSVVIPANDFETNSFLKRTLESLQKFKDLEIVCVDLSEAKSRGERLNIGFHRTAGTVILFHHPRSFVDPKGIKHLIDLSNTRDRQKMWGGFTHTFDKSHALLRFTSWYSNSVRGKRKGILYLDHCIYFDRELWQDDIPHVEIFEDTLLSYHLLRYSKPIVLPYMSQTSAIRFEKNGVWRQSLMNQVLKLGFFLNVPHEVMNRIYEKGLGLNKSKK